MTKTTVSSKGQVVIPKQVRDQFNLQAGTELSVKVQGDNLILRKVVPHDWRRWEGAFTDLDLLRDRARERRQELQRDEKKARR